MALEPAGPPMAARTEYVCPMHPEVVQDQPGNCPKCGMALEPRTVQTEEDDSELRDMSRRFWGSAVLAVPVFLSAMAAELWPEEVAAIIDPKLRQWLELILATLAVLWGGWPFYVRAVRSLITRNLNMFTLIALGVSVAWVYSVVAVLLPGIFPPSVRNEMGLVPVYFEAAAVITVLVLLGQVLELRARSQTNAAIKLLLGLAPKTARLVRADGEEEDIPLERVKPGDVLRIRPGEKVPVDGEVIEGESSVDEPMVTGTDVAMESAGVTLVKGGLRGIARARRLSHATMRNIRQNLFFALVHADQRARHLDQRRQTDFGEKSKGGSGTPLTSATPAPCATICRRCAGRSCRPPPARTCRWRNWRTSSCRPARPPSATRTGCWPASCSSTQRILTLAPMSRGPSNASPPRWWAAWSAPPC
jgi:hypothetical protein